MKKIFVVFTFILSLFSWAQKIDVYEKTNYLTDSIHCNNINDAIELFEKGKFNKPIEKTIYKKIPKEKTVWLHFCIPKSRGKYFFTISNSYLHYGKVYSYSQKKIDSLPLIDYAKNFGFKNTFYRHPTWELDTQNIYTDYFVKIKDNEPKTRLELSLLTTNEFLERNQIEYFLIGTTITFLATLILLIVILFFIEKRYTLLWYGGFIFFIITTILANKGVGVQYFWSSSDFLVTSAKSFSQTLATMCAMFFYANFYPFPREFKLAKQIFKTMGYCCAAIGLVYLYKIFTGNLPYWYLTAWVVLKICLIVTGIIHFVLLFKKIIPLYLGIGFMLSITGTFIYQLYNPIHHKSFLVNYFFSDIFYISLIIELSFVVTYIVSQNVKAKFLSFQLEKENLILKENIQTTQDIERNNLAKDIHDSFGGHIATLKLLLNFNDIDKDQVENVLEELNKQYRLMLTNKFVPNITTQNFTQSLEDYCSKMTKLTTTKTSCYVTQDKVHILNSKTILELYKIISELSTNVIKHAKANTLQIDIDITQQNLELSVKDNGIGFDTQTQTTSIGLESVKNRVKILNGKIHIKSNSKEGTHIIINLPL